MFIPALFVLELVWTASVLQLAARRSQLCVTITYEVLLSDWFIESYVFSL